MSLINKMLQDLDKRHAADGGGTTLTQQLRPVPARKDWRRMMWEVGAGLIIGAGWAAWVMYQISPHSIVTDLAFQSQAKRLQAAGGLQAPPAPPAAQPPLAPVAQMPAQAAAQVPPAAAMPAPAVPEVPATAPAPPATKGTEPVKAGGFKFATEIATPINEKSSGGKSRVERKSTQQAAPAAKTARQGKPAT